MYMLPASRSVHGSPSFFAIETGVPFLTRAMSLDPLLAIHTSAIGSRGPESGRSIVLAAVDLRFIPDNVDAVPQMLRIEP